MNYCYTTNTLKCKIKEVEKVITEYELDDYNDVFLIIYLQSQFQIQIIYDSINISNVNYIPGTTMKLIIHI